MGFKDMVQYRKAQGYNCIAILAALPAWANDGHPFKILTNEDADIGVRSAWQQMGAESAKDMHNEGGRPFLFPGRVPGYEDVFPDVERLNPAYFQYMALEIDYLNSQGITPFIEVARRDVSEFLQLAAEIGIKPEVQEFALEDANRALLELKSRRIRGAKVLKVG